MRIVLINKLGKVAFDLILDVTFFPFEVIPIDSKIYVLSPDISTTHEKWFFERHAAVWLRDIEPSIKKG